MCKLIESTLVSIDGVVESPERWANFDGEASELSLHELDKYDAFVMGRVTYEHRRGRPRPARNGRDARDHEETGRADRPPGAPGRPEPRRAGAPRWPSS